MGIPYYFKYISNEYPDTILEPSNTLDNQGLSSNTCENEINFNYLFLDFNCLIHPCCHRILDKYKTNNANISNEQLELEMCQEIKRYLLYIKDFVKPNKMLYIAIDGVAPRAKMVQQRSRRYRSILLKNKIKNLKKKHNIENGIEWDTNAITPGTKFQAKLSKYLQTIVHTDEFKDIDVIISDSTVPGEGEHKILQYIRNNNFEKSDNFAIYGLDADLIMLSMACKIDNIYLLREAVHFGKINCDELLYLNIKNLKKNLFYEITTNILTEESIDIDRLVDDYIAICFLLGNDFLPHLTSLQISNDGIHILLNIYCTVLTERKEYLVNDSEINTGFLKNILHKLLITEDETVLKNTKKYYRQRVLYKTFDNEYNEALEVLNKLPLNENKKSKGTIRMGSDNWRNRYYKQLFKIDYYQETNEIIEICLNYFEGIYWTAKYYFDNCCSWQWYYRYHYSPTIKELYEYLDLSFSKIELSLEEPVSPYEQLLLVLPPQSYRLLPNELQSSVLSYESPIISYYPYEIKLDMFQKKWLHECEPKLPLINYKFLKLHYENKNINSNSKKHFINKRGTEYIKNVQITKNVQISISC